MPLSNANEPKPPVLQLPRWATRVIPFLIGAVLLWHLLWFLFWRLDITQQFDLQVYRNGGIAVFQGSSLYDEGLLGGLMFNYPPFAALIFTPLALVDLNLAIALFMVINLVLLWFVVSRCWSRLGYRRERATILIVGLLTVLTTVMEPVRTTLYIGQINIVVLSLVVLDLLRVKPSRWLGVGIGIAAGIKLTPLIFIPYLLLTKRFRVAGVAVASFLGTVVLGFILSPNNATDYWFGLRFINSNRVGITNEIRNQSLRGMLARLINPPDGPQALWLILAILLVTLGMTAAVFAYRSGSELLGVTLVGLCSAAISPFSWAHHWVWFVPLAVFLTHQALTKRRRAYWVALAGLFIGVFILPTSLNSSAVDVGPEIGIWSISWPGQIINQNTYLLIFLATAVFAVIRFRPRKTIEFLQPNPEQQSRRETIAIN